MLLDLWPLYAPTRTITKSGTATVAYRARGSLQGKVVVRPLTRGQMLGHRRRGVVYAKKGTAVLACLASGSVVHGPDFLSIALARQRNETQLLLLDAL